jgi:hypothetical protein
MNQRTDAGVDYRQPGRSNQTNLDTHHEAHEEQDRPAQRSGDEGEPPPALPCRIVGAKVVFGGF